MLLSKTVTSCTASSRLEAPNDALPHPFTSARGDASRRIASGVDVADVHQDAMQAHYEEVSIDEQRKARLEKH